MSDGEVRGLPSEDEAAYNVVPVESVFGVPKQADACAVVDIASIASATTLAARLAGVTSGRWRVCSALQAEPPTAGSNWNTGGSGRTVCRS